MTTTEFLDIFTGNNTAKRIEDPFAFALKYGGIEAMYQLHPGNTDIQMAVARQYVYAQRMYQYCRGLFANLANTDYAVIKGAVLSQRIYPNPAIRKSSDIDILISPNQIDNVKAILEKHGFKQGKVRNGELTPYTRKELIYYAAFTHQAASFSKLTEDPLCPVINIDINTDIFWGESSQKADMDDYLSHTEETEVFGIKVKRLTTIHDFIALCLHHYKDLNSLYLLWKRGISLSTFCDIYYYLEKIPLDTQELKQICNKLNVAEYVYCSIFQTNIVFERSKLRKCLNELVPANAKSLHKRIGLSENQYKQLPDFIANYAFDENFHQVLDNLLTTEEIEQIKTNDLFL